MGFVCSSVMANSVYFVKSTPPRAISIYCPHKVGDIRTLNSVAVTKTREHI